MLCGSRVRVEFSHGRGRSKREERGRRRSGSRSPRSRKRFSSNDLCYECGGIYFYKWGRGWGENLILTFPAFLIYSEWSRMRFSPLYL